MHVALMSQNWVCCEQEVKKSNTLRSQLDAYKRQTQELQSKMSDETKRADKAEFESKRLGEKMTALQREKEVCRFCFRYFCHYFSWWL